ncbi:MAG: hypothetical protein ACLGSA_08565 [Acidobacteriota bacterium]
MPVDHWLNSLSQSNAKCIAGDLVALGSSSLAYPFLSDAVVANQIELLSGHLARVSETCRRLTIAYSLYMRQMDAIQDASVRVICAGACDRPPVGCCNANHHVILSPSDVLVSRPTNTALHLSHVITGLQRSEHEHRMDQGSTPTPGYCSCLSRSGCTLSLFKSPLCAHYLCVSVQQSLRREHGAPAAAFIEAMHAVASQTVISSRDFTDQNVLNTAVPLFPTRA